MTLFKKSIAFSLLAMLAGCSSTPYDLSQMAQEEVRSFSDFDLSETDSTNAMQVMHLYSRRAVANANNIDQFTKQNHNMFLSATQGVAVGAAVAGSINPFQLATKLVGLQATKSSIAYPYRSNTLISIAPVSDPNDINKLRETVASYQSKQIEIAKNAYNKAGFKTKTVKSGVDVQWSTLFPREFLIPLVDDSNSVGLCQNPDKYAELKDEFTMEVINFECFTMTNPIGYLYNNNTEVNSAVLPNSDSFIVITTELPDLFPVQSITMDSANKGVMLYQPTFYWMESGNIKDYARNDMDTLLGHWEKGMFSYEPKITDLATGYIHKFGDK